ncbi:MAG TPA: PP2C family serine/threonine-protein phosphatase [Chthonomonas sp.]|uniref:PP2C family serine/threonine-protein phosphatase n=1 Tax=Chthonomonas sp. TaxID=2282153 RepID=UPI002B4B58DC|nr:PP2C family serine/threonine-protein phosphatase [Chthonomonas sp.]HLI47365.1 PP2C family serine/threonine-protein phosphatase [Chthonomonas sp.]
MDKRTSPKCEWKILGTSVQGALHRVRGLPCQDAHLWSSQTESAERLVAALADGHGSARSFRSDIGARFAVETAVEVLGELLKTDRPPAPLSPKSLQRSAERIVERWREKVRSHFYEHPITAAELEALQNEGEVTPRDTLEADPFLIYGTTLLAFVASGYHIALLQIGDGDALVVYRDGQVTRPILKDARHIANETTSLCMEDAAQEFRFATLNACRNDMMMIMLSTDGYVNSFVDEKSFFKAATDLAGLLANGRDEDVKTNLETWLSDTSREGSGDDITVLLIASANPLVRLSDRDMPRRKPFSWPAFLLGLAIGALLTAAIFHWWPSPKPKHISIPPSISRPKPAQSVPKTGKKMPPKHGEPITKPSVGE